MFDHPAFLIHDELHALLDACPFAEVDKDRIPLALHDIAFVVAEQKLDGVLDGDDLLVILVVDVLDDGGQGGGFAGPGRAREQDQARIHVREFLDFGRQVQGIDGSDVEGDGADDHGQGAALEEDVDAKPGDARHAVGHVDAAHLAQPLLVRVGQDFKQVVVEVVGLDAFQLRGRQDGVDAKHGRPSDLEVQVRRAAFHHDFQQVVESDGHVWEPRSETE